MEDLKYILIGVLFLLYNFCSMIIPFVVVLASLKYLLY